MDRSWYRLSPDEVIQELESARSGLSALEANQRFKQYGPNLLKEEGQKSHGAILYHQFSDIMIFILLVAAVLSWAMRSERDALWTIGFFSNPKLMGAVFLTLFFQMAITYHPMLQSIFHTTALPIEDLMGCVAVASTVYFLLEAEKWWRYRRGS